MATLNLTSHTLAFDGVPSNSNPSQKYVDWKRPILGVEVDQPKSNPYVIDPGAEALIFDGSRSTAADNTSAYSLTLNPMISNRYRITWTGGLAPVFRTARNVLPSPATLTLTVNGNNSITVTGSNFSASSPGDTVLIPGSTTGDTASPFDSTNEGYWVVLGANSTSLTMTRMSGEGFQAFGEVVAGVTAVQFLVYSVAGVQVGDTVDISSGFSSPAQNAYKVVAATTTWFEFESTLPLATETGVVPGASGILFYTNSKRFLRIEFDQRCVIRMNGDNSDLNACAPWEPANKELVGEMVKVGAVWKLSIVNKSTARLSVLVISAE